MCQDNTTSKFSYIRYLISEKNRHLYHFKILNLKCEKIL